MRRTPPRPVTAAEASSTPRWAGTWNDVTNMIAAWAQQDGDEHDAAHGFSRVPD